MTQRRTWKVTGCPPSGAWGDRGHVDLEQTIPDPVDIAVHRPVGRAGEARAVLGEDAAVAGTEEAAAAGVVIERAAQVRAAPREDDDAVVGGPPHEHGLPAQRTGPSRALDRELRVPDPADREVL